MRVRHIMTTSVIYTHPTEKLPALSEIFKSNGIHHLPVVDAKNNLVGILSDRDVDKALSPFLGSEQEREQDIATNELTAEHVMTPSPITIEQETRIDTASILLLEHNFSCLPVTNEDGVLEGILSWKDILNFYVYAD
ncbi:MAG: CBS domain-containing protein [Gammaproteobacteria bacterium]|nr:CBS domain-containing protein [Gammaproteobacteria bacterium]NNJ71835.1 CBS domain-containing protein [Enterobacterales bacterium]